MAEQDVTQKRLYLVMEGELQVSKGGNDIAPVIAGEFAGEVREYLTSLVGSYICCVLSCVRLTGFSFFVFCDGKITTRTSKLLPCIPSTNILCKTRCLGCDRRSPWHLQLPYSSPESYHVLYGYETAISSPAVSSRVVLEIHVTQSEIYRTLSFPVVHIIPPRKKHPSEHHSYHHIDRQDELSSARSKGVRRIVREEPRSM